MKDEISDYDKCISRYYHNTIIVIECKLGLWSAEGGDVEEVEREAMYYWRQYAHDGEYSSIIGGKTVVQVLNDQRGK